jgi:hypothetical protein
VRDDAALQSAATAPAIGKIEESSEMAYQICHEWTSASSISVDLQSRSARGRQRQREVAAAARA